MSITEKLKETVMLAKHELGKKLGRVKPQTQLLFQACRSGNVAMAKKMIELGADINATTYIGKYEDGIVREYASKDKFYATPLWVVAYEDSRSKKENKGYVEIAKMLMSHPKFNPNNIGYSLSWEDENDTGFFVFQGREVLDLNEFLDRSFPGIISKDEKSFFPYYRTSENMFNVLNERDKLYEFDREKDTYKIYYPNHQLGEEGLISEFRRYRHTGFALYYENGQIKSRTENGVTEDYREDGTLESRCFSKGKASVTEKYDEKGHFVKREVDRWRDEDRRKVNSDIKALNEHALPTEARKTLKRELVEKYRQKNPKANSGR